MKYLRELKLEQNGSVIAPRLHQDIESIGRVSSFTSFRTEVSENRNSRRPDIPVWHPQPVNLWTGKSSLEADLFLSYGHKGVNTGHNSHLSLHRIAAGSEEVFNPKVLFDPLDEEFYPPPALVQMEGLRLAVWWNDRRKSIGPQIRNRECFKP